MATINTQFKPNIPYLYEISYSPQDSTDRPEIRNINITNSLNVTDTDLIGHIENAYIGNGNTTPSGTFTLTYTGSQRTFTSNINFVIDGITDYENGLNVPLICNGTLERDAVRIYNSSQDNVIIHIKKVSGTSAPSLTIKFQIGNNVTDNWIISRNQESVNPNNTSEINNRLNSNGYVLYDNSSIISTECKLISFKIDAGKSLWIEADDTYVDNTRTSNKTWCNESQNLYFADNTTYNQGKLEISGDIMSLITENNMGTDCFRGLFKNFKSLKSVSENFLSANNLSLRCYYEMFSGCTNLISAPDLSAMSLAVECYRNMFSGCTKLENIPEELPATNLLEYCYHSMFTGCTSLTTAPELPAETLARSCYQYMFNGCTSLNNVPELNAKTLDSECCRSMFDGCTSLQTIPTLSASILTDSCYKDMFSGCTSLNNITMLATDISATDCLDNWVSGVSATGTFTKYANTTISTGNSGIPSGWTVQDYNV